MIKTLQKKFIFTAMTAITVLILLLLGTINAVNVVIVKKETDSTLEMLSENEGEPMDKSKFPSEQPNNQDNIPPDISVSGRKNDYDTFMSSNFFVVRFDDDENVVYTDVSRTSTLTEDEATVLALSKINSENTEGITGKYRYKITGSKNGIGKTAVFLDISSEILSYVRILALSAGIGIICWGLMLLFVILLSRRAIRPIAINMEKQKQFVTDAGHEIKTPLAIIQSNTEAMELYNGETKWSRNIKEQTYRLSELMQSLLTLSKSDEGICQINTTTFSVSELVREIAEGFSPSFEMKNISFKADITPELVLTTDRTMYGRLASILLDNAVKYTNEGGNASVSLRAKSGHIYLSVENTCDSLPEVPPEKLFDRFYRSDKARTQKTGGYGIGLSVALSVADTLRGNIRCEYSEGNTIKFTFKL